jgi:hypothetical protein
VTSVTNIYSTSLRSHNLKLFSIRINIIKNQNYEKNAKKIILEMNTSFKWEKKIAITAELRNICRISNWLPMYSPSTFTSPLILSFLSTMYKSWLILHHIIWIIGTYRTTFIVFINNNTARSYFGTNDSFAFMKSVLTTTSNTLYFTKWLNSWMPFISIRKYPAFESTASGRHQLIWTFGEFIQWSLISECVNRNNWFDGKRIF